MLNRAVISFQFPAEKVALPQKKMHPFVLSLSKDERIYFSPNEKLLFSRRALWLLAIHFVLLEKLSLRIII